MSTVIKGFLSVSEFSEKTGVSRPTITNWIKEEKIKGAKRDKVHGDIIGWVIPESQLRVAAGFKKKDKVHRGPYNTASMREAIGPIEPEVEDISLEDLENYVPEGKIPFKKMVLAVSMTLRHLPNEDIEYQSGMKRIGITALINEYKMAIEKDRKKYPTLMAYLKAGRPFRYSKRNLLDKGNKK